MKKVLIIFGISLLLLFGYEIVKTYAIFESDVLVQSNSPLAKWEIAINGKSIDKNTTTFTVDNVIWSSSNHVVDGKAAPGSTASFEISIDPHNTQVAIKYDVILDFSMINNPEIRFLSLEETNGKKLIKTGEDKYTGVLTLEDIDNNRIDNLLVKLVWNNNEENNENDSAMPSTFDIPVIIKFEQYLGEEIVEG